MPVQEALPNLQLATDFTAEPTFELTSSFTLDGELTESLVRGGA